MKLEEIGFYTLSDDRAKSTGYRAPLQRCELIITDVCNFNCPYCRGPKHEREKFLPKEKGEKVIKLWAKEGLKNIRFSGGEPTLHKDLPYFVELAKSLDVERIAVSTNGSNKIEYYRDLISKGVNDFSISLDACCAEDTLKMTGGKKVYDHLVGIIRELSRLTYVTVGMVFTEHNIKTARESVGFASSLGVSDIRIISAAQYDRGLECLQELDQTLLDKHPILKYRIERLSQGQNVRGIEKSDNPRCPLVLDDMIVAGDYHFPCVIYMREGGDPIGEVGEKMRSERAKWFLTHDTHGDPICKKNCLDICIAYNNKVLEFED